MTSMCVRPCSQVEANLRSRHAVGLFMYVMEALRVSPDKEGVNIQRFTVEAGALRSTRVVRGFPSYYFNVGCVTIERCMLYDSIQ